MMRFVVVLVALIGAAHAQSDTNGSGISATDAARADDEIPTVGDFEKNDYVEKCPAPTYMRYRDNVKKPGEVIQTCMRPRPSGAGKCPFPYVIEGSSEYAELQAEHYELRPLGWTEMMAMEKAELREFMRTHNVPYLIRIKVLDLHDATAAEEAETSAKRVASRCVPSPPFCAVPWVWEKATNKCVPPEPHMMNPILDDAWVSPVLKDYGDDDLNGSKPGRIHQEVLTDENDKVLQKNRHSDEDSVWDFEVNRISTAH